MDISICFADFPTEAIGVNTRAYRQLGIGYANLGALLMASGPRLRLRRRPRAGRRDHLADDRHGLPALGRAGRRRRPVRRLRPQRRGARPGHAQARRGQRRGASDARHRHARSSPRPPRSGPNGNKIGEKNGWRNAQASVLAPTGTIGLMMDCDTTGIEPDLALVKFKKLVGGGSMQIVNQTVPRALRALGYQEEQVEAIVEYIAEHGHVIDAPGPAAGALRGLRLRDGRAGDQADGPRADDGGGPAVPLRRDLQDGQPAGDGDRRGHRGRLLPGLEARPEGAGGLPRQLQGRPAAVGRQGRQQRRPSEADGGRERRRVPADPQAAAEVAAVADDVVLRRRRRGLHDRRAPTRTTASARCSSSWASRARPWPA